MQKKSVNSICDRKYDVIPVLIETAKSAMKEKVIRVIVATFRVRLVPPPFFWNIRWIMTFVVEPCHQSTF